MSPQKINKIKNGIGLAIITGIIAFMALFAWHSRHEAETTCAMARPGMSMDEFNRANGDIAGTRFSSNKEGTEYSRAFPGIAPETTVFCVIHTRDNIITDSHLRLYGEPLPEEPQEPEEGARGMEE
ncbi:hypothetical protein [Azovibrio restrictus]|uniref:hypothetical protein n=1 Tax=Azovibrio restrictus TaxID=146938 RepID=UPI000423AD20|nr:hypothetical protein [Azovibrio restrictus]